MGNKTKFEIQMQTYGGFQSTLRKQTPEQRDYYAAIGTPEHNRHEARVKEAEDRQEYRKKAKIEFERENKPMFGNTRGCTPEEVSAMAKATTDYNTNYAAFLKDMDKNYPEIELYFY